MRTHTLPTSMALAASSAASSMSRLDDDKTNYSSKNSSNNNSQSNLAQGKKANLSGLVDQLATDAQALVQCFMEVVRAQDVRAGASGISKSSKTDNETRKRLAPLWMAMHDSCKSIEVAVSGSNSSMESYVVEIEKIVNLISGKLEQNGEPDIMVDVKTFEVGFPYFILKLLSSIKTSVKVFLDNEKNKKKSVRSSSTHVSLNDQMSKTTSHQSQLSETPVNRTSQTQNLSSQDIVPATQNVNDAKDDFVPAKEPVSIPKEDVPALPIKIVDMSETALESKSDKTQKLGAVTMPSRGKYNDHRPSWRTNGWASPFIEQSDKKNSNSKSLQSSSDPGAKEKMLKLAQTSKLPNPFVNAPQSSKKKKTISILVEGNVKQAKEFFEQKSSCLSATTASPPLQRKPTAKNISSKIIAVKENYERPIEPKGDSSSQLLDHPTSGISSQEEISQIQDSKNSAEGLSQLQDSYFAETFYQHPEESMDNIHRASSEEGFVEDQGYAIYEEDEHYDQVDETLSFAPKSRPRAASSDSVRTIVKTAPMAPPPEPVVAPTVSSQAQEDAAVAAIIERKIKELGLGKNSNGIIDSHSTVVRRGRSSTVGNMEYTQSRPKSTMEDVLNNRYRQVSHAEDTSMKRKSMLADLSAWTAAIPETAPLPSNTAEIIEKMKQRSSRLFHSFEPQTTDIIPSSRKSEYYSERPSVIGENVQNTRKSRVEPVSYADMPSDAQTQPRMSMNGKISSKRPSAVIQKSRESFAKQDMPPRHSRVTVELNRDSDKLDHDDTHQLEPPQQDAYEEVTVPAPASAMNDVIYSSALNDVMYSTATDPISLANLPPIDDQHTQIILIPLNGMFDLCYLNLSKPNMLGRSNTHKHARFKAFLTQVVSRNHVELWEDNGKVFVKDVGSSSGTFLNGVRLSEAGTESTHFELQSGDYLQLGKDYIDSKNKGQKNVTIEPQHRCVKMQIVIVLGRKDKRDTAQRLNPMLQSHAEESELPSSLKNNESFEPRDSSSVKVSRSKTLNYGSSSGIFLDTNPPPLPTSNIALKPVGLELGDYQKEKERLERQISEQQEKWERGLKLSMMTQKKTQIPEPQNGQSSPSIRQRLVVSAMGTHKIKKLSLSYENGTIALNVNLKGWESRRHMMIEDLRPSFSRTRNLDVCPVNIDSNTFSIYVAGGPCLGTVEYVNSLKINITPVSHIVQIYQQYLSGSPSSSTPSSALSSAQIQTLTPISARGYPPFSPAPADAGNVTFSITGDFKESSWIVIMKSTVSREQRLIGEAKRRHVQKKNVRDSKWSFQVELEDTFYSQLIMAAILFTTLH